MNEVNKNGHPLDEFYTKIYKRYDLINRIFTLGFDRRWRRVTAKKCLAQNPRHILDLCCGTADLALTIRQIANSAAIAITGYDFNANMLSLAKEKAAKQKFIEMDFQQGDAAKMPFSDGLFDAITIGFGFRNLTYQNPNATNHLSEISRVLSSGGSLYILESSVPVNPVIRFFYRLYLIVFLIPLGTLLSGNQSAYSYLANSSANFFRKEEVIAMLEDHGFTEFENQSFFFGATNLLIATKKDKR